MVLDVLGILFAEAGPRLVRINKNTSVLLNGNISDDVRNATILKINSHADLIKYGEDRNTHYQEKQD